jgi:hypothetical protein
MRDLVLSVLLFAVVLAVLSAVTWIPLVLR